MTYKIVDAFTVWGEGNVLFGVMLKQQVALQYALGKGPFGGNATVAPCKLIQVPNEDGGTDSFMLAAGHYTPIDLAQDLQKQRREIRDAMLAGLTPEQRTYFEAELPAVA
jgi:hypothetical protein